MKIAGLQKMTLLDFPGKVACTVFLDGCNFRCPFCHNTPLLDGKAEAFMTEEELFAFLQKRKGILDGVCVTGGEPTLQKDLTEFLGKIKAMGYAVKLDTNGTNPDMLESLINDGLVDYVAMDIKSSRPRYAALCGVPEFDTALVERSVEILLAGKVKYEFRTTVVRELHTADDFVAIGEWIKGARAYFLQPFKDSGDIIEDGFSSYSEAEISDLLDVVKMYIPNAQIRG